MVKRNCKKSKIKKPNGYKSRIKVRRAKRLEKKKSKKPKELEKPKSQKNKEDRNCSLFFYPIINFTSIHFASAHFAFKLASAQHIF